MGELLQRMGKFILTSNWRSFCQEIGQGVDLYGTLLFGKEGLTLGNLFDMIFEGME